jgi:hypothetical protein
MNVTMLFASAMETISALFKGIHFNLLLLGFLFNHTSSAISLPTAVIS